MNLLSPMTKSNYFKISKKIHKVVQRVSNDCTEAAQVTMLPTLGLTELR